MPRAYPLGDQLVLHDVLIAAPGAAAAAAARARALIGFATVVLAAFTDSRSINRSELLVESYREPSSGSFVS